MKSVIHSRFAGGFSLIEVMIAVVVLSVGLLALAALQANLIRSSSESKAQTVGLSLAKDRIEDLRTYTTLDDYRSLTDGNDAINDVNGSLGGVDYTRTWTIERFAFDGAAFVALADTGLAPATYPANNEFKRISVNVSWVDASGDAQNVAMEDAIGAIDPYDSARLAKLSKSATPRRAEMIITNPAGTAGVIPIAIGSGTDTAATNPRPEVAGRNNNQRVVETRFDIFTYAALSGGAARAQSRVETAVVGCRCDLREGGPTVPRGKRPTYWDGERYVVPANATYNAPAGHAVLGINDPPDSRLCDVCCRDHHDPDPTITTPKFDPRRSGHEHYAAGALDPATNEYQEACRIIRVDGIFRIAADMYNDKFGLLATASNAALPVPSSGAVSGYQAFVLNYLDTRVTTPASGYNTRTNFGVPYADGTNDPSSIDINAVADFKWLHSRGLYMDYLETDAIARIDQAKLDCVNRTPTQCDATEKRTAVLRLLPFTTINLSELSNWSPISGPDIVVTNNDFISSLGSSDPVRGKVLPGGSPTSGATPNALTSIFESNSGVALLLDATDPAENASPLDDAQAFRMVGSTSGGGTFTVTFGGGYPFAAATSAYPEILSVPGATCNYATTGGQRPNPYSCTAGTLGIARTLTIGRYNYQVNGTSKASIGPCTDAAGNNPVTWSPSGNDSYNTKVCKNFAITAASGGGAIVTPSANDGTRAETTDIIYSTITNAQAITLTFGASADTLQPMTCRYVTNGETNQSKWTFTVNSADCP